MSHQEMLEEILGLGSKSGPGGGMPSSKQRAPSPGEIPHWHRGSESSLLLWAVARSWYNTQACWGTELKPRAFHRQLRRQRQL